MVVKASHKKISYLAGIDKKRGDMHPSIGQKSLKSHILPKHINNIEKKYDGQRNYK